MNGHILVELEDKGIFYCKKCNKGEIELQDKCEK